MLRIGMVGLGNMGRGIAKHFLKGGYPLTVYDIRPEAADELVKCGAKRAESCREVGTQSDILFLMVLNAQQCNSCLNGEDGVLAGMRSGTIVILSTVGYREMKSLAALCEENGLDVLDSPVSGGVKGAADGTLTLMVSGRKDVFDRCKLVLSCFGRNVFFVGGTAGQGQAMKVVNQMLVAINMIGTAEAFTFGARCGIDPQTTCDIIKTCSGRSFIWESRGQRIVDRDFSTMSTLDIVVKDTTFCSDAAQAVGAPAFLTRVCLEMFEKAREKYPHTDDMCEVVRLYEECCAEEGHGE